MDALIFDFDGVILNSEPLHYRGFMHVLERYGISVPHEVYNQRYLGLRDEDGIHAILSDYKKPMSDAQVKQMISDKTKIFKKLIRENNCEVPGATSFIRCAYQAGIPSAICSGSLRYEISAGTDILGISDHFAVIVSAEDVQAGKPDPQGYLKAAELLSTQSGKSINPCKCVVCEDSPTGIKAAKSAGMKVCALTTSYPPSKLPAVDMIVDNLSNISPNDLSKLVNIAC